MLSFNCLDQIARYILGPRQIVIFMENIEKYFGLILNPRQ